MIVWAPLWAIVYLITINWNLYFVRNKFHTCMHILHGIHLMYTILTLTPHIFMLERTHCGRKSHLVKFCFNRINSSNFVNKNVWVSIATNPHGPKKIWVPKSASLVFDIGVGSHKTWEDWCLGGGCIRAWWTYPFNASLSRKYGGRTTSFFGQMNWLHRCW